MKHKKGIFGILVVLLLCGVLVLISYMCGGIGISERRMRNENQGDSEIGSAVYGNIGQSMAVFLDLRENVSETQVKVYVQQQDRLGWFLRMTMDWDDSQNCLQKINCEGNGEYLLLWLSTEPISHIEIKKPDGSRDSISPIMGHPFAYIMDHSWEVTVYAVGDSEIQPYVSNM